MVWNTPFTPLWVSCPGCPVPTSCAPPAFSLAGHEKLKNPWLYSKHYLATTENISVINILHILNSKHSAVPATKKTVNSIPAETTTVQKKVVVVVCLFVSERFLLCHYAIFFKRAAHAHWYVLWILCHSTHEKLTYTWMKGVAILGVQLLCANEQQKTVKWI